MRWLYSFLSADRRKTYCLYEAPSPDAIRRAAARAGVPADVVVEMAERVLPDGSSAGIWSVRAHSAVVDGGACRDTGVVSTRGRRQRADMCGAGGTDE